MIARGKRVQGELTKNPTMFYVEEGKPNELTRQRMSAAEGLVANWDLRVHPTASREEPGRKVAARAQGHWKASGHPAEEEILGHGNVHESRGAEGSASWAWSREDCGSIRALRSGG